MVLIPNIFDVFGPLLPPLLLFQRVIKFAIVVDGIFSKVSAVISLLIIVLLKRKVQPALILRKVFVFSDNLFDFFLSAEPSDGFLLA